MAFASRRLPYFQAPERREFFAILQFIQRSLVENGKNSNVFDHYFDAHSRRFSPRNLPNGIDLFDGFVFNIYHVLKS